MEEYLILSDPHRLLKIHRIRMGKH